MKVSSMEERGEESYALTGTAEGNEEEIVGSAGDFSGEARSLGIR